MQMSRRLRRALGAVMLCSLVGTKAHALGWELPGWNDQPVNLQLNTTMTLGASVRMERRANDLIGKSSVNPDLCGRENGNLRWQGCQGLFRTQTFTADRLVSGQGQFNNNADDGNLNYDRYDLTQAPFKTTVDFTASRGDFGFFFKALYFYDIVNNHFTETHRNQVNADNYLQVANVSVPGRELLPDTGLPTGAPVTVANVRNDSIPCGSRNPTPAGPCGLVFGRGALVRSKRNERQTLKQIGTDLQFMEAVFYGQLPIGEERNLSFKIGRQTVNWGESTLLVFDSLNQANPIEANNFLRTGFQVEEVFTPIAMAYLSTTVTEGLTVDGFYQLEWQPTIAPAPGSFYSFADIGSNNAGPDVLTLGFGSQPDDPDRMAVLIDNPLSGVTNTSLGFRRLDDREPGSGGQFGLSLKYYAEWLNGGTELSFYFMNYHARLPMASVNSVDESCQKHSTSTVEFTVSCVDVPLYHAQTVANDPYGATDSAIDFDGIQVFLDYPKNIKLYGFSFNTTVGDFSLQGEVAYRPKAPLQVDLEDLAFAAFGPSANNCHLPETGCTGSGILTGIGKNPDGTTRVDYPSSDFVVDAAGTRGSFNDTFDLNYGHAAGSGRYFPSFVIPYRGMTLGLNPANSYIRGWENFDTFQFNLGGTYLMGATERPSEMIGADQIILLYEAGATWVPGLPALDVLQLEAPGTFLHASAGADGSGADRSRQACSTNVACSYGPDGIRFNPHQEDLRFFPDKLSYGYDLVFVISYESVLPGISLRPTLIWKHDVKGTAPGLASNFVQGRKYADLGLEIRYKSQLSFNLGYNVQTGGGKANLLHDRDTARAFVKYQF